MLEKKVVKILIIVVFVSYEILMMKDIRNMYLIEFWISIVLLCELF